MSLGTRIEWADATFNPWVGCTKVSPACDHCYAEAYGKRFGIAWGPGARRVRASESYWRQPLAWDRKAAKAGKPLRVFCASLADVFDEEVASAWRLELLQLITATPHLIWMLLTKRPNVALRLAQHDGRWPRPNVWLGVTVENQAMADLRIPLLLQIPAAKHFLSCEPLLGPVDLCNLPNHSGIGRFLDALSDAGCKYSDVPGKIDWVITGGESGPHARPMHPDWARSLRDQCQAAGVPFFFKQWGGWAPGMKSRDWMIVTADGDVDIPDHRHPDEEDGEVAMTSVGKKAAGRLLDGREWNDLPAEAGDAKTGVPT